MLSAICKFAAKGRIESAPMTEPTGQTVAYG